MRFVLSFFLIFIISSSLQALQILPPKRNAGSEIGRGFGEGFAQSFKREFERENARREYRDQEEEDAQLVNHFISHYDPENHAYCISLILQSRLRDETKKHLISHLKDVRKEYFKNKR